MNTKNQTQASLNTAATNASEILLGVNNENSGGQAQGATQQLLECLDAKLDLVISNQLRLEEMLAARGIVLSSTDAQVTVRGNANA